MSTAGQDTKMLRGAIWACAIPMGIGLISLFFILIDLPPNGRHQNFESSLSFILLPIALCFLFGTPLAAWLACLRLRRVKDSAILRRWHMSAWWGLLSATAVHFGASLFYTILSMFLFFPNIGTSSPPDNDVVLIIFLSAMLNGMLWVTITLPLSIICATIFWRVTKFPEGRNVF